MTDELNPHVAAIVDELMTRFHNGYDPGFVRDLVSRLVSAFDGAPVQDFVEVLVLKEATAELRRLDALQPIAS
jgi:hypothetical protein